MTDGLAHPGRDCPLPYRRVPGARLSEGRTTPQGTDYFLKTPSGELLALGEGERFLWDLLDGTNAFEEIEQKFRLRFGATIAQSDLLEFIAELIAAGAVEAVPEGELQPTPEAPRVRKIELARRHAAVGAEAAATTLRQTTGPGAVGGVRRRGSGAIGRMAGERL